MEKKEKECKGCNTLKDMSKGHSRANAELKKELLELKEKLANGEAQFEKYREEAKKFADAYDTLEKEVKALRAKIPQGKEFMLTRDERGDLITIGNVNTEVGFWKAICLSTVPMGLYETSLLINDIPTRNKASDMVGEANMQGDKTLLDRLKQRIIEVLQKQMEQ